MMSSTHCPVWCCAMIRIWKLFLKTAAIRKVLIFKVENLDLGVEVTRAYTPQQNEYLPIVNNYFGKNCDPKIAINNIKTRFVNKSHSFRIINKTLVYFSGCYDTQIYINELQKRINEKSKLLNRVYKVFRNNWLYLFAGSSVIHETDIANLSSKEMKSYQIQFNRIFINCFDRIYIVENNELIQAISLNEEELTQIKKMALERIKNE